MRGLAHVGRAVVLVHIDAHDLLVGSRIAWIFQIVFDFMLDVDEAERGWNEFETSQRGLTFSIQNSVFINGVCSADPL